MCAQGNFLLRRVQSKELVEHWSRKEQVPSLLPIPLSTLSLFVLSKPEAWYFFKGHFIVRPILWCLPTSHPGQPSAVVEVKPLNQW